MSHLAGNILFWLASLFQQNKKNITDGNSDWSLFFLHVNIRFLNKNSYQKRSLLNAKHHLPYVLSLSCNDRVLEATGIGLCEMGPLYLEQYLQRPIEQEIGIRFKTAISRDTIIEIGDIVTTCRVSGRLLFILLFNLLSNLDREWIVFTSDQDVECLLKKMKLKLFHLTVDGVASSANNHDKELRIQFCHIPDALSVLRPNISTKLSSLFFSDRVQELADIQKIKSG